MEMLLLQLLKLAQNQKKQNKEEVLPSAPFRMTKEEMRCADKRALIVCVPQGYGWKPSVFFCKKVYLNSHDWKQVYIIGLPEMVSYIEGFSPVLWRLNRPS